MPTFELSRDRFRKMPRSPPGDPPLQRWKLFPNAALSLYSDCGDDEELGTSMLLVMIELSAPRSGTLALL